MSTDSEVKALWSFISTEAWSEPRWLPGIAKMAAECQDLLILINDLLRSDSSSLKSLYLPQALCRKSRLLLPVWFSSCNLHSVQHSAAGLQGTEGTGSYLQYLQANVKFHTPAQPRRSRSSSLFWPYSGQINPTVKSARRSHWPFTAAGWKHTISETTPTRHASTY